MTRRDVVVSLLLLAPLSTFAPRAGAEDKPAAQETDGVWKPVSAEFAGTPFPQNLIDTMKLTLKDGKYAVEISGQGDEGTVTSDPAKSPKTMDIQGTSGPNKGKTFLVIYELKGDELRICYDLSGKSRPAEFASKPETQLFLVTYRKAKP